MDALSEVLKIVKLSGALFFNAEFSAPWRLSTPHCRVLAPVLTDVQIDWGTLPVADVYPRAVPDLFSAKPILVHGRLTGPAEGTLVLRGARWFMA